MATMQARLASLLTALGTDYKAHVARQADIEAMFFTDLPTGAWYQHKPGIGRSGIISTAHNPVASGRLNFYLAYFRAGQTVNTITFQAGSTAGASITNSWACVYSLARAKLSVSNNDTTAAWASAGFRTFTFGTPYVIPTSGYYYVGLLVAGTTMPTLSGSTNPAASATGIAPICTGTSTTGLTNPASAPTTAAALTAFAGHAYFYIT